MSHPMWVRGLKPVLTIRAVVYKRSHPMWVRGLKPHAFACTYPP